MKILKSNTVLKPLLVVLNVTLPVLFLIHKSQMFIQEHQLGEEDLVVITEEFIKSFYGGFILVFIMVSIIQVYTPPKIVTGLLFFGGVSLIMSALLETLGVALILYGATLVLTNLLIMPIVKTNDLYASKKLDRKANAMLGGKTNE